MTIFSGGIRITRIPSPSTIPAVFSFLDMADSDRAENAIPESITLAGGTANAVAWFPQDISGDNWVEHWGDANGTLTRAAGSYADSYSPYHAGFAAGRSVYSNSSAYWTGASGSALFDPGNDDFIMMYSFHALSSTQIYLDSGGDPVLNPRDGLLWYRDSNGYRRLYVSDGTTEVNVAWSRGDVGASAHGYRLHIVAFDRDVGAYDWLDGNRQSGLSTAYNAIGHIGHSGILSIGARQDGGLAGKCIHGATSLWKAPAGWLDNSDTTELNAKIQSISAGIWGRRFTTYQGAVDNCGQVCSNPNQYDLSRTWSVNGVSNLRGFDHQMPVQSTAADGDLYLGFASIQTDFFQIPAAEIPDTGVWTVEFSIRSNVWSNNNQPIFSISDGTIAEHFLIRWGSSGEIEVISESASGDNGQIATSGTMQDGSWHTVSVAAQNGFLSLKVDGSLVGTDTSSTMPVSPDTMYLGCNGDKSTYGSFDIRYGEGYGLQLYNVRRH